MPKTPRAHAHTDAKHLLRWAAAGIEDAEALLPRFERDASATPKIAPKLTPEWESACRHLETLADLRDDSIFSTAQAQQFVELKRRVEKLRPGLRRLGLLEPRLEWPHAPDDPSATTT